MVWVRYGVGGRKDVELGLNVQFTRRQKVINRGQFCKRVDPVVEVGVVEGGGSEFALGTNMPAGAIL